MLTRTHVGQSAAFQSMAAAANYAPVANPPARPSAGAVDANALCKGLTGRQREVLSVMLQGKSNKAICRALNLAEPTVKNHVTAILKALNVTNRTEAVLKVTRASVASMSYSYTVSGYPTFGQ
jgi:DNA-binding NarL/FixJ family response regulator